ncbi:hypothetical protein Lal_00014688, partial [Lupinus albus]
MNTNNTQFPQQPPPHGSQSRPLVPMYDNGYFPPQATIKPPNYISNNLMGPTLKIEQYFNLYQVAPNQRVELVAFSMKGDALSWYKWMFNTNQLTSWEGFTKALLVHFGPSIELTIQQPFSVTHAIGLEKLVESKITETKTPDWHSTCPNMVISNNHNIGDTATPTQQQIATSLPIKQLTVTQIAHGLCYNCDEEYIVGHRCKSKQFLHLQIDERKHTYHNIEPISTVQNNDYRPIIENPNQGIQKSEENIKKHNLED